MGPVLKHAWFISALTSLVIVQQSHPVDANVFIQYRNGSVVSFNSVPIKFDGNTRLFENVTAPFGVGPQPDPEAYNRILWVPFRGWSYPYIETVLEDLCRTQKPAAIMIYHASDVGFGGGFSEWIYTGASSHFVTVPVVEIDVDAFVALNTSMFDIANVTITPDGVSDWRDFKLSWYFPFYSVTVGIFSAVVFGFAIRGLLHYGLKRHIASMCLSIELLASTCRLIFCLDPFSGWRILPTVFRGLFLSISWPMTLISSLLLTFFWAQLIDMSTFELNPIITRSRIPAVVTSILLMSLELIVVSLRISFSFVSFLTILNGAVYFLACVACMAHYLYVSIKVLLFLRTLPRLGSKEHLLRAFTLRAMLSTFGYAAAILATILAITPFEARRPYGNTVITYISLQACNFIGLMTCVSFLRGIARSNKPSEVAAPPRSSATSGSVLSSELGRPSLSSVSSAFSSV